MIPLGYQINWHLTEPQLKSNPLYQKWSVKTLETIASEASDLKTDLKGILMNADSAPIASYLAWLSRMVAILGA